MTAAEFAERLVDNVATATQLDPEKGELANVEDWRRNAESLFAFATGAKPTKPKAPPYKRCPTCAQVTYRADGIDYCTDHEPKEPR